MSVEHMSRDELIETIKAIGAQNIQKGYLVDALSDILYEVTNDVVGLPRDELLDVLTEVRELAEAALKREGAI